MTFKEWFEKRYKDRDPLSISAIDCSSNKISSLQGLEVLVNLEVLNISYNKITSLKGIEGLVNLKKLYYYSNDMTSLQGIESLVNLEGLYYSNNNLNDLKVFMPVLYLPNLKNFYFNRKYHDITDFKKRLKYISNISNILK